MPNHVIHDLAELETALRQPRLLLLKYSPICVISATARAEWEMFQLDCADIAHSQTPIITQHSDFIIACSYVR